MCQNSIAPKLSPYTGSYPTTGTNRTHTIIDCIEGIRTRSALEINYHQSIAGVAFWCGSHLVYAIKSVIVNTINKLALDLVYRKIFVSIWKYSYKK